VAAAEMAISSPLLEASIDGAHGVLLSIQGGSDLGLFEINESAQLVANSAAPEANIIFGAVIDDALGDEVRVTVIAAGFGEAANPRARPAKLTTAQGTGDATFRASPLPASPGPVAGPGEAARPGEAAGPPAEAAVASPADAGPAAPHSAVTVGRAMAAAAASRPAAAVPRAADGNGAPASRAAGANGGPPRAGDADGGPPPRAAQEPPRPRPDAASAARVFDAATTTRRRSVVFEEDDELDVPDFLK
jgi:cell division protein FtsZ